MFVGSPLCLVTSWSVYRHMGVITCLAMRKRGNEKRTSERAWTHLHLHFSLLMG